MIIPEEIFSLVRNVSSGQRLIDVLSAAPEGNDALTEVVGCLAAVLRERAASSDGVGADATKIVAEPETSVDFSTASSVVEQLMFLHPRGKQMLGFFGDRLVIQTSKQQIVMRSSDVTDVVVGI